MSNRELVRFDPVLNARAIIVSKNMIWIQYILLTTDGTRHKSHFIFGA